MSILNLTQHVASPQQIESGVIEPENKKAVQTVLTFDSIPIQNEVWSRANVLAQIALATNHDSAMIGGAPYLMGPLERALNEVGIKPVYAFSVRESVEKVVDGKTVKTNVFKHIGFVEA